MTFEIDWWWKFQDEINSQSQGNLSELIADVEKLKQFHISQNNPPLVDAGADISGFFVGQTNQLSGWTIDPDSEITSIEWTQISGSPATIDDADTLTPYITPSQPDEILIFQLEVVDEWGGIGTDEVNVTVEP